MLQNSEKISLCLRSEELTEYLTDHFGFHEKLLQSYGFYELPGNRIIFMSNQRDIIFSDKITQIGLPAYKGDFPRGYITNAFIYRFGGAATRNVVEVDRHHLPILLNRQGIHIDNLTNSGYRIITSGPYILGRGWVRGEKLYMDAPKIWKQNLAI